ncbi:MAG: hypothetical protein M1833_003201 [Piccolia ochrophora]|nr:MAG: hypothetical protein M1833_003201 [Piccolia ochrophora]
MHHNIILLLTFIAATGVSASPIARPAEIPDYWNTPQGQQFQEEAARSAQQRAAAQEAERAQQEAAERATRWTPEDMAPWEAEGGEAAAVAGGEAAGWGAEILTAAELAAMITQRSRRDDG